MEHYVWQLTHISYCMIRRICLFFMLLSPSNQKPDHYILLIICFLQNMFVEHYVKTAVPYFLFHDQNNMFVLCVINSIKSETWTFIHHFGLNHQTIEHTVCNAPSLSLEKYEQKLTVTVETLYSTIYYSKYFIELHIDKSTQYVALWTHKRHPIPRPFGRAMECLLWVLQQKLIVL